MCRISAATRLLALLMALIVVLATAALFASPLFLTLSLTVFMAVVMIGVYRSSTVQGCVAFKARGKPKLEAITIMSGQNEMREDSCLWTCRYPTGFRLCDHIFDAFGSCMMMALNVARRLGALCQITDGANTYAFNARDQSATVQIVRFSEARFGLTAEKISRTFKSEACPTGRRLRAALYGATTGCGEREGWLVAA